MRYTKYLITVLFLLLFYLMLSHPAESIYYAFMGLTLWFQKMIPTLFPFMLLSGLMVRMNLTEPFAGFLRPVLRPFFPISANGIYVIVMGFLCGFPMGAKVISELYERDRLSKEEAEYLLSFCNNIGPIYFLGFALPLLHIKNPLFYLLGMYGVPLLYGMLLLRIKYSHIMCASKNKSKTIFCSETILFHIDETITSSIESITKLGGYMILFNLLTLIPALILPDKWLPFCNAILEITGEISRLGNENRFLVLTLLAFGGFSCIAQTYSIIKKTDLSIANYCLHRMNITVFCALYYGLMTLFL